MGGTTYAIVRTPRQGGRFALLLAGPFKKVWRRWERLDVRQGTALLMQSGHPEPMSGQSGPNLRSVW